MSKTSLLVCLVFVAFASFVTVSVAKGDQGKIKVYELKKGNISLKVTNWGATIISVFLPDKTGKVEDVVLGFDSAEDYKTNNNTPNFGALVGRVINRIGGASFKLNGTTYKLDPNEGKNTLHGGRKGFGHLVWRVRKYKQDGLAPYITFTHTSYDGDQGFPGTIVVSVTYMLLKGQQLSVIMNAKAINKATPINLAQHTYWNLGGQNSGNILSNKVQILASQITQLDSSLIPTGKILPVKNTPYDFLQPHTVGSRINKLSAGYDINYVIDKPAGHQIRKVAMVHDSKSGRMMELFTNAPAVQFYTANTLHIKGKGGYVYGPQAALCLETQGFPDAVNHPNFPSIIVGPGQVYKHLMLFKFSTK